MRFAERAQEGSDAGSVRGTGDRFDGKWEDGYQNGVGVFTFADGSSYNGYWRHGRKHGVGKLLMPLLTPRRLPEAGVRGRSNLYG